MRPPARTVRSPPEGPTATGRGGPLPRHRPPMPPPSEHASDASAAVSGVIAHSQLEQNHSV